MSSLFYFTIKQFWISFNFLFSTIFHVFVLFYIFEKLIFQHEYIMSTVKSMLAFENYNISRSGRVVRKNEIEIFRKKFEMEGIVSLGLQDYCTLSFLLEIQPRAFNPLRKRYTVGIYFFVFLPTLEKHLHTWCNCRKGLTLSKLCHKGYIVRQVTNPSFFS